ncbi:MAG: M23 family metallopeptidase [Elusimicrobia bacterium]|nr:M23 family metallopeptidase [Elusimicrobiota bacterium]
MRLTPARFGAAWNHFFHWQYECGRPDAVPDRGAVYLIPFARGVKVQVRGVGGGEDLHIGEESHAVDFQVSTGAVITAARGGRVVEIRERSPGPPTEGRGDSVLVQHDDGTVGQYFSWGLDLKGLAAGKVVQPGDPIARHENPGRSVGYIVHFGVFVPQDGIRKSVPLRFAVGDGGPAALRAGQVYSRR